MNTLTITIVLIAFILMKALGDGYNYIYNTTKDEVRRKKAGIVYHLFGLAVMGIPITLLLIYFGLYWEILGFAMMYFGMFDPIYNFIAERKKHYIGKTDIIDRLLGRIFDKNSFTRWMLVCLRWAMFWGGTAIIRYL